jgi:DNA-binding transcriptional regulator YiaG
MKKWTASSIKNLRKVNRLSQKALSKFLGVTTNYVYLLEKGVRKPSKTLCLLLDCIGRELKTGSMKGGKENGKGKRNL